MGRGVKEIFAFWESLSTIGASNKVERGLNMKRLLSVLLTLILAAEAAGSIYLYDHTNRLIPFGKEEEPEEIVLVLTPGKTCDGLIHYDKYGRVLP